MTIRTWLKSTKDKIYCIQFMGEHRDFPDINDHMRESCSITNKKLQPILDREFDDSYGIRGCPDFVAWSAHNVYYVDEYDGSMRLCYVPRNPPGE